MGNREDAIALDYIPGKATFHNKDKVYKGEEALHVQRLILKLKNAIMYYIVRNREERKVPKLSDILHQAIEKQKKEKEERRRQKQNMTLENLEPEASNLTSSQYEQIEEVGEKI